MNKQATGSLKNCQFPAGFSLIPFALVFIFSVGCQNTPTPPNEPPGPFDHMDTGIHGVTLLPKGEAAVSAVVSLWPSESPENPTDSVIPAAQTQTDFHGIFSFPNANKGKFRLTTVWVDELTRKVYTGLTPEFFYESFLVLDTIPLSEPGSILITVTDDNGPLPKAKCFSAVLPYSAISGEDGICRILNLPYGTYHWHISAAGYTMQERDIQLTSDFSQQMKTVGMTPAPPPADKVSDLAARPISSSGVVMVQWKEPALGPPRSYKIFLRYLPDTSFQLLAEVEGLLTSYADTAYKSPADTVTKQVQYALQPVFEHKLGTIDTTTSFIINAPLLPKTPFPANQSNSNSIDLILKWETCRDSLFPTTFDVWFGTDSNNLELISQGQSKLFLRQSHLMNQTTYYWRIITYTHTLKLQGPIWSFKTAAPPNGNNPPSIPLPVYPKHTSENIPAPKCILKWKSVDKDATDIILFDVYLSSEKENLIKRATRLNTTSLELTSLTPNTTYYWQIVVSDGKTTALGPVWHFRTMP